MRVIGITGRSGCGKIDGHAAVRLARLPPAWTPTPSRGKFLQPGSPCIAQFANAFGSDIVEADGTLRRRLLADRSFATKEGAARLTAITHPEILRRIAAWIEETRRTGAALAFVGRRGHRPARRLRRSATISCSSLRRMSRALRASARATALNRPWPAAGWTRRRPKRRCAKPRAGVLENDSTPARLEEKARALLPQMGRA